MTEPYKELASVDKLVHEPARLSILTALLDTGGADFLLLLHLTGLAKGGLSAHLAKLEEAGLVETERGFVRRKTRTMVNLTDEGRTAIEGYWSNIEELRKAGAEWGARESQATKERVFREAYGGSLP